METVAWQSREEALSKLELLRSNVTDEKNTKFKGSLSDKSRLTEVLGIENES